MMDNESQILTARVEVYRQARRLQWSTWQQIVRSLSINVFSLNVEQTAPYRYTHTHTHTHTLPCSVNWGHLELTTFQVAACQAGDAKDLGHNDSLQQEMATHSVFLRGQRSQVGYSPWVARVGHNWLSKTTVTMDICKTQISVSNTIFQ